MPDVREYRHQPAESRRRGLPAIGFSIIAPEGVELVKTEPVAANRATLLVCRERDEAGRVLGELEIGAFSAALIMDRDGILAQMVEVEAERALTAPASGHHERTRAVEYAGGARGYRSEVVLLSVGPGMPKPREPYLSFCALGSAEIIDAGLFVSVRSQQPSWTHDHDLLESLRIVRLGGSWNTESASQGATVLPFIGRRR
jgi:hypothetical protein